MRNPKPPRLIPDAAALHRVQSAAGMVLHGKKYFYDLANDTLIREDMLKHRKKFREWSKFVEYVNSLI
jgi:hypothetical protein